MATNALIALIVGVPSLLCTIAIVIGDARPSGLRSSVGTMPSLGGVRPSHARWVAIASAAPSPDAMPMAQSLAPVESVPAALSEAPNALISQMSPEAVVDAESDREAAEGAPRPDELRPQAGGRPAPQPLERTELKPDSMPADGFPADIGAVSVPARPSTAVSSEDELECISVAELLAEVETHLRSLAEREPEASGLFAADSGPDAKITLAETERYAPRLGTKPEMSSHPVGVTLRRPRRSQGRQLLGAAGVGAALAVIVTRW